MSEVTVTFQLNPSDIEAFIQAVKRAQKRVLWLMVMWLVLLRAVLYALKISFERVPPPDFAFLGWRALVPPILDVVGAALIFAAVYTVWVWMQAGKLRNSPWLRKPTTISVDEAGIFSAMGVEPNVVFWPQIHKIIESEAHFIVSMGALNGIIIPKRAFDSPAECAECAALLKRKWAEHHGEAAPIAALM